MGYLRTVTGNIDKSSVGLVDGHTHVWIDHVGALDPQSMILNDRVGIERELRAFRAAGGQMMLDCQPAHECGRNGTILRELSDASGVAIVASTGFHLRRYYPQQATIYSTEPESAYQYFLKELQHGLSEDSSIRAGFIKIACEATLKQSPAGLIRAAVQASLDTGAAIQVHTERGSDAEQIMQFVLGLGLSPSKLILCHMDKRPDRGLHQEIAASGVLLEYDSFLRPKYQPEQNAWPLLQYMIENDHFERIILATDLADPQLWQYLGSNGLGAVALINHIGAGLRRLGLDEIRIAKLLGGNVVRCLELQAA